MEYCKYHPISPARYHCSHCHIFQCDICINEGPQHDQTRCFLCDTESESLGATFTAEPFWRRLQASFRYPANSQSATLIIGVAFLMTAATFVPLTLVWYLILTGIFIKYCFSCLEKTAQGSLAPPDITVAYEGGILLALQMIFLLTVVIGSITASYIWLGAGVATLISIILVGSLPAMLINFAFSENILTALNPLKILQLITSIGLPYGLLLGLIVVMLASVGVIHELIGFNFSFITMTLQSAVSNYYSIVIFHIMGYMIFQYQAELGFIAREENDKPSKGRSDAERLSANISITIKEGDYTKAAQLFKQAVQYFPEDKSLSVNGFDFILAIKNQAALNDVFSLYSEYSQKIQRLDQLAAVYRKITLVYPDYIPQKAKDNHCLAKACLDAGDARNCIALLQNIHKRFPEYDKLDEAYMLLANALRRIPGMDKKVEHCLTIAKHFRDSKTKQTQKTAREADKHPQKTKVPPPSIPASSLSLQPINATDDTAILPSIDIDDPGTINFYPSKK